MFGGGKGGQGEPGGGRWGRARLDCAAADPSKLGRGVCRGKRDTKGVGGVLEIKGSEGSGRREGQEGFVWRVRWKALAVA
jgi:hypothetical protein